MPSLNSNYGLLFKTDKTYKEDTKKTNLLKLNKNTIASAIGKDYAIVAQLLNTNKRDLVTESPILSDVQDMYFEICEKDASLRERMIEKGVVFKKDKKPVFAA